MIRIHYFPDSPPESAADYTEANHWGTITDGAVTAVADVNGPDNADFNGYIEHLKETLFDGVIDPIAVTDHLTHGDIRAVVPSKADPANVYTGQNPRDIVSDGQLAPVETHEAKKYGARDDDNEDGPVFKEYELAKDYDTLVIHTRDGDDLQVLGRIDVDSRKVTSEVDDRLDSMVRYLLTQAPTLNPVAVMQHNTRTRVAGVIDPDTETMVFDVEEVKRTPAEIAETVTEASQ